MLTRTLFPKQNNAVPITKYSMVDHVEDIGGDMAEKAPRTKMELLAYFANVLEMRLPYTPTPCDGHSCPADAVWDAYSGRSDFSIWQAMRGSGKTWDISASAFVESIFKPNCGITILGGSLEQSTKAIAYLELMWAMPKAPRHLLASGMVAGRGYKLTNGSWVQALAASPKSVRGPHPQKLRLDEVDEMDRKIYEASLGQPKSNYGIRDSVIVSSTLHHPFGLMSELIDERHKMNAKLYAWCVKEMLEPYGFWSQEEIDRKRMQLTKNMWEAEYELKRPSITDTIFDFEFIDMAFMRGRDTIFDKRLRTEGGIDWGHNVTVLNIIQDTKDKFKVVESHCWELMELTDRCTCIADICLEKGITTLYADSNPTDSNVTLQKTLRAKRVPTKLLPVAFNKFKGPGINVIRYLLEKKLIDITDPILKKKMQIYHYKNSEQEVIAKEDDHYPDALIAWAASKQALLMRHAQ